MGGRWVGLGEVGVWGRVTFSDCGIVCECECVWGGQRLMHVWCVHIQGSARIPAPALFRVIATNSKTNMNTNQHIFYNNS